MLKKFLYLKYLIHSCSFFILMQIYDKKTETQSEISCFVINSRNLILEAVFIHYLLHPFLYFPPRLPQVYRSHKDAKPRLLIPIRKVEILIHGRVVQSSASIQSMRLAPVFLVYHVRKNLREMLPANLLPAAKLRNSASR